MATVINGFGDFKSVFAKITQSFQDIDYSASLTNFMPRIEHSHAEFFASSRSPGGEGWAPLAPATVARKGHDTILVDKKDLRDSLSGSGPGSIRDVQSHGLLFGTSDEKSIFHTLGTTRMPKREHVGLSPEILEELTEHVADATVGHLKGLRDA